MYHNPVLLNESIEALDIQPNGVYVDVTFGGGGHTRAILDKLGAEGRVLGFDQDEDAQQNEPKDSRFMLLPYNFRYFQRSLRLAGVREVDGVLADLGVSSYQFDTAERGFSYRFDAQLDMRMNNQSELTAQTVLNKYTAEELQQVLGEFGEVRNAKTLAQAIVKERQRKPFQTINELLALLDTHVIGNKPKYLAQVFQAIRIAVNDEMEALKEMLQQATQLLKPNGRLAVITYHSLEDRIVKNWMKHSSFKDEPEKDPYGNTNILLKAVHKKPIEPSAEELKLNKRAHSAKLRTAYKL